jgi:hypothetical protein
MDSDSAIFRPSSLEGLFAEIAARVCGAAPVESGSRVVPTGAYAEPLGVPATHIGLDVMRSDGYFVPLVLVPLRELCEASDAGPYPLPLFRLAWYGHG